MEGMSSRFVHCAAGSTPPHFVVDVVKNFAQGLLAHTLVWTKQCHICCAKGIHGFGLMLVGGALCAARVKSRLLWTHFPQCCTSSSDIAVVWPNTVIHFHGVPCTTSYFHLIPFVTCNNGPLHSQDLMPRKWMVATTHDRKGQRLSQPPKRHNTHSNRGAGLQ